MRNNLDYIKAILLIVLVLTIAMFTNKRNQSKEIALTTVSFSDESKFVSEKEVKKIILKNSKKTSKDSIQKPDLYQIEKSLTTHKMIADASLYATIDGELNAIVRQRKPIARVLKKKGGYYIDEEAKVMPLSENYTERVLLINGSIDEKNHAELFKLANSIVNDPFLKKQIVAINLSRKGVFSLKTRVTSQNIILGTTDQLKTKLDKYKALYAKMSQDKLLEKYKSFNLAFNNQVVCIKA